MIFKFKNLIVVFVAIIATNIFFKEINKEFFEDNIATKIIFKIILTIFTFILLSKYSLLHNLRLRNNKNIFFIIISIILISISYYFIDNEIKMNTVHINPLEHFLFFISCFTVGLFEELFFRIFIFYFIIKIFEKDDKKLLKSIILTSIIFGFSHFSNLLNPDYNKLSVINQSLFAISIGIMLQSLFIRFNSLIFIVTLHALINYIGSYKSFFFEINKNINSNNETNDFFSTLFSIIVFSIITTIISYFLVRKKIANDVK